MKGVLVKMGTPQRNQTFHPLKQLGRLLILKMVIKIL